MQSDTKIICRRDRYAILSQVQELPLRDGSTTKLHLVQLQGEAGPSRFLRAIANDVAGTFIFDVTALAKELDLDIRQLPARDTMGVISLTLRQKFLTGATLRMAIIENCLVSFRDGLLDEHQAERHPGGRPLVVLEGRRSAAAARDLLGGAVDVVMWAPHPSEHANAAR